MKSTHVPPSNTHHAIVPHWPQGTLHFRVVKWGETWVLEWKFGKYETSICKREPSPASAGWIILSIDQYRHHLVLAVWEPRRAVLFICGSAFSHPNTALSRVVYPHFIDEKASSEMWVMCHKSSGWENPDMNPDVSDSRIHYRIPPRPVSILALCHPNSDSNYGYSSPGQVFLKGLLTSEV